MSVRRFWKSAMQATTMRCLPTSKRVSASSTRLSPRHSTQLSADLKQNSMETEDKKLITKFAVISFSIVAEGTKVADVQTKAGDIEKKVLAFLKEKNIADKDVKTQNYSLSPRYEYRSTVCSPTYCPPGDNRTLVGYEVRESILVKVRSVDSAGEIVGGLGTLGVTDMSGVNLTVDDPDKVKRDARTKAIADAEQKAEELASDLGVTLSRIVSFTEGEGGTPPMPLMMEKFGRGGDAGVAVSAALELPVGENIYRSTVSITYEIE